MIERTNPFQSGDIANFVNSITATKSIDSLTISNFTINGNSKTINGADYSGFLVNTGEVLNINSLTMDNFTADSERSQNGGAVYNLQTVNISNSTFINNYGVYGGAIYNNGNMNVSGSTFSNNTAPYGSAIYNDSNGVLTIRDSTISNNFAYAYGSIHNKGSLEVVNTIFSGNTANANGAAIYNDYSLSTSISGSTFSNNQTGGGLVYNDQSGDLVIVGSTFNNNTSSWNSAGIYQNGSSNLSIDNSSFSNNSGSQGGAVLAYYNSGFTSIKNSTFSNNSASSQGGAVNHYNSKDLLIENSTFTANSSNSGGAIYFYDLQGEAVIKGSTISNNSASYSGAGIYLSGYSAGSGPSSLSIIDSDFESNTAGGTGGALYYSDGTGKNLYISDSTFTSNKSSGGGAANLNGYGTAYISDSDFTSNSSTNDGGAIWSYMSLNISNSTFINNSAKFTGGALLSYSNLSVSDSVFTNNKVQHRGGAIFSSSSITDSSNIVNSEFYDNSAIAVNEYDSGYGGAIYTSSANFQIDNSIFSNNSASAKGGAIYNDGTVTIKNSSFVNNTATEAGGAIYASYNELNIVADNGLTFFKGNKANNVSNALYIDSSTVNFNAGNGGIITFFDRISSASRANFISMNSGSVLNDGTINLFEGSDKVTFDFYNGRLNIGQLDTTNIVFNDTTLNLKGGETYITNSTFAQNSMISAIFPSTSVIANSLFNNNNFASSGVLINNSGTMQIYNTTFDSNSSTLAVGSGAIFNSGNLEVISSTFKNNSGVNGGTIYNFFDDLSVTGSNFENNTASDKGGAIYNYGGPVTIANSGFVSNSSSTYGGAIYMLSAGDVIVDSSTFTSNSAIDGGAFASYSSSGSTSIKNSIFSSNSASNNGGALHYEGNQSLIVDNSRFSANLSVVAGGAMYLSGSSANTQVLNSTFSSNTSNSTAGAIFNSANLTVSNSVFNSNSADAKGGAIHNQGTANISDSLFSANTAVLDGGAIFNQGTTTIKNTSFVGNTAGNKGAAIYLDSGTMNIIADSALVAFDSNRANGESSSIFLHSGTLNLNSGNGGTIIFNDKIASDNKSTSVIKINSQAPELPAGTPFSGNVYFNNTVENSTISLYGGTVSLARENLFNGSDLSLNGGRINLVNNSIGTMALSNLNVADGTTTNLGVDADLYNLSMDRLTSENMATGSGKINISNINLLSDARNDNIFLNFADPNISDRVTLGVNSALGKIYQYNIAYNSSSGQLNFSAPTGFNPAVLPSPVAANTGNYINQVNSYQQAFFNMDLFMLSPQLVRNEYKYKNRYADAGSASPIIFSPLMSQEMNKGLWFRPYSTFENVPLKNGPTVSNVAYGGFIGGDIPLRNLGHGFDGTFTAYVGYNGSHQSYDNVSVYQNGGLLGMSGTFYKGNFFTALTANVGASSGEASTMYGPEYFTMLSAGLASKTGYNFEFARGKFIIQPSLLLAYTFVNTFDYTNAAGVNITSEPLNAIQVTPGVKFIANLKNGLQPYLGISMVWSIMDQTKFYANEVPLPQMSINPYVQYGVGVQKRWGDRFTGFFQAMIASGGRNGLGLQAGFRWAI